VYIDFASASLIATIKTIRSDLLQDRHVTASPIPLQMPASLQKEIDLVAGVGEPTTACFLTRNDMDPTGWYGQSLCHLSSHCIVTQVDV
jgi:hypothetical protein